MPLRLLRAWNDAGLKTIRIAVNLSQIQLRSACIVEDILVFTSRHGIAPHMLMFEITETVAMQNAEETMRTIDKLQLAGFDLTIDEFGTGYCSLSFLQQFGVQQMKLDLTFINNLGDTGRGRSVVAAIIRLAHSLDMEAVAEAVEIQSQLAILQELNCAQTQGCLLARPTEGSNFIALLNERAEQARLPA